MGCMNMAGKEHGKENGACWHERVMAKRESVLFLPLEGSCIISTTVEHKGMVVKMVKEPIALFGQTNNK